jgi:hypothetical protein
MRTMSSPRQAKLRLKGSNEEAIDAIVGALPSDAIVRNEDDGVGRFAGERTLVIVGPNRERLMMFRGSWGNIKGRLETPQLDVVFERREGGVTAKLVREEVKPPSIGSHVTDVLSQSLTVALIVVAYHMFQSMEMDYGRIAIIAVVGGVAWSLIGHFMPKKEDRGLERLVHEALKPLVVKPKKAESPEKRENAEQPEDPDPSPPST